MSNKGLPNTEILRSTDASFRGSSNTFCLSFNILIFPLFFEFLKFVFQDSNLVMI